LLVLSLSVLQVRVRKVLGVAQVEKKVDDLAIVAAPPRPVDTRAASRGLMQHAATNHLLPVVKNRMHLEVKNHLVIGTTPRAGINLTPRVAGILTLKCVMNRVHLSRVLTEIFQTVRRTRVSLLGLRVTMHRVPPHQVARRLRLVVMV
jgi:hypothetical protein